MPTDECSSHHSTPAHQPPPSRAMPVNRSRHYPTRGNKVPGTSDVEVNTTGNEIVESTTSGGVSAPSTLPLSNFADGHMPSFRTVPRADTPAQFQIHRPATLREVCEDYGPMEDRPQLDHCHPKNFANPAWLEFTNTNYLSKYRTSVQQLLNNFRVLSIQIMVFEYRYPSLEHPIHPAFLPIPTMRITFRPVFLVPDEANALFQRNQANKAKWLEQDSQRQQDHVDAFAAKSRVWRVKVDKNCERIKSHCAAQTKSWTDLENDCTRVLHHIRREINSVGEMLHFKISQEHPPVPVPPSPDVCPSDPSSHTVPLKHKRTSAIDPPEDDATGDDIVIGGGEIPPISHIDEEPDSDDNKPILPKVVVPLVVQGMRTRGRPAKGKAPDVPTESTSQGAGVSTTDSARNTTAQGRGYPVTINGKYVLARGLEEFGVLSEPLLLLVFFYPRKGVRRVLQGWPPVHRDPERRSDAGQVMPPLLQVEVEDRALSRVNVMWVDLLVRAIIDIFTELLGINVNKRILHGCMVCHHSPDYTAESLDTASPFPVAPSSALSAFASTSTSTMTQPATFVPSDLAVAQLTSLLSSPDQPVFKSLLDGLVKKGRRGWPAIPPRDILHASVESGDGSSKAKKKGKAKADAPPRVELPAPGPDAPTTPQPQVHQHTTSPLISSGSLRFNPSLHIGGTSLSSISSLATGGGSTDGLVFRGSSATSSPAWASQPPRGSPSKPYSRAVSTRAESATSRCSSQTNSPSNPWPSFRLQLRNSNEDHDALEYGMEEDLRGDALAAMEASGMDTSEG
ncbi:hypothetical protein C8R44DRAFT_890259 [Mycena epipterygia]|nr:hypothetical protein C8R44DRAFT_890259 [Mycena epipterygia]